MIDVATRNRAIKKVVEQAFGVGRVKVRGHRGTAYGWVTVKIGYAPRNWQEQQELRSSVLRLIDTAGLELFTYLGDDGTNTEKSCIHIDFLPTAEF